MKTGDTVHTPYGEGKLLLYREIDCIYVVELTFAKAKLYAGRANLHEWRSDSTKDAYATGLSGEQPKPTTKDNTMELNVAYEALESMRKLNLELQFHEMGFFGLDLDRCTTCLFEEAKRQREIQQKEKEADANGKLANWLFRRSNSSDLSSLSASISKNAKKGDPCLVCGSPTCKIHSCRNFRKEGITLCLECSQLFKLDFVIDSLTCSIEERAAKIDRMVETYDRTLLLLRYSSQFIDDLAHTLEQKTEQQNKVQVGSSASGIVSGTLGVASAVMIFTPVGPPLLIASLLFGASATAVQSGSKAMNYHSDSNKLADRILALYGMLNSILRLSGTLRDAMLRDHIRTDMYLDKHLLTLEYPEDDDIFSKHSAELMAGMTLGRVAGAAGAAGLEASAFAATASAASMGASETISLVETGAVAGRNTRLIARSSMTAMQTARFVQFAGGAISAFTLVLEAHCMNQTIQAIKAGNPCAKANLLRAVKDSIETASIPSTAVLDKECHRYLSILAQRERAMTEKEVVNILLAFSEEAKAAKGEKDKVFMEGDEALSTGIATDLNESDHDSDDIGTAEESGDNEQKDVATSKVALSPSRTAPLTPRSKISLFARITKHKKEEQGLSPPTTRVHRRSQPSTEFEDPREVPAPRALHGAYVDSLIV